MRDPYNDDPEGGAALEFRMTYEGCLLGASRSDTRASHKHDIRRVFHKQLRNLWRISPNLRNWTAIARDGRAYNPPMLRAQWLAGQYERNGHNFIPLVTEELAVLCGISVLVLRPDAPGALIKSGDLDNRLKTLLDAFRLPKNKAEFGGYDVPEPGEDPFFCLLEDDRLFTKITLETDTLLQPLEPITDAPDPNDVRLVITVNIRRMHWNWSNGAFE